MRADYPIVMTLKDHARMPQATVGLRTAECGRLFLEQYLDRPIEIALSEVYGRRVQRAEIVEIGNLASRSAFRTLRMLSSVSRCLRRTRIRYAAITATRELRHALDLLGFQWSSIAKADQHRLGQSTSDWGSYYSQDPVVIVGKIQQAAHRVRRCRKGGGFR